MSMKEFQRRVLVRWLDSLNDGWRSRASCRTGVPNVQTPMFFSWDDSPLPLVEQRRAASFCNAFCPVKAQCLEYALNTGEQWGVWGGTTEPEREHLMKKSRTERREAI